MPPRVDRLWRRTPGNDDQIRRAPPHLLLFSGPGCVRWQLKGVSDPVLHLVAGPNDAGKTTLHDRVIEPATHLLFINADLIAHDRWPGKELEHAYETAAIASAARAECLAQRQSFATETVFSHPSKIALL